MMCNLYVKYDNDVKNSNGIKKSFQVDLNYLYLFIWITTYHNVHIYFMLL